MMLSYPYGWIWAGGFFFLFIVIVMFASPVVMNGAVCRVENNDHIEIRLRALFGLIHYRIKVPFMSMNGMSLQIKEQVAATGTGFSHSNHNEDEINVDKVSSSIDKFMHVLHITKNLKGWVKGTLSKVKILEWHWSTSVGTNDAMWTAMATGAVWTIKTAVMGIVSQMVYVKNKPIMAVHPNYRYPAFATEWSCTAHIRFGYAVLAGLQLLVRMKKWKGGVKA